MKILIASPIDPDAIKELQKQHQVVCAFDAAPDVLISCIEGCEILIFRSGVKITGPVMEGSPELKLIIRAGSGVDNIDMEYVRRRGLELVRIPEPGAKAVAEMCLAFMLALSRSLLEADRKTKQGHWIKHEIAGYLLEGKTLGIIGTGNIGSRVGQMAAALGMEVIGCVEHPSADRADELRGKGIRLAEFDEVVSSADYVSIHVPLKDSTRGLVNAAVLERMKPGSYLINLARGGVLDEAALYTALTEGDRIRGAALDVHQAEGEGKVSPLAGLPNVILTPHIGAMTIDTQREIGRRILETVQSHLVEQVGNVTQNAYLSVSE